MYEVVRAREKFNVIPINAIDAVQLNALVMVHLNGTLFPLLALIKINRKSELLEQTLIGHGKGKCCLDFVYHMRGQLDIN